MCETGVRFKIIDHVRGNNSWLFKSVELRRLVPWKPCWIYSRVSGCDCAQNTGQHTPESLLSATLLNYFLFEPQRWKKCVPWRNTHSFCYLLVVEGTLSWRILPLHKEAWFYLWGSFLRRKRTKIEVVSFTNSVQGTAEACGVFESTVTSLPAHQQVYSYTLLWDFSSRAGVRWRETNVGPGGYTVS